MRKGETRRDQGPRCRSRPRNAGPASVLVSASRLFKRDSGENLLVTAFSHRRTALASVKCVRKGAFTFSGDSDGAIVAEFGAGGGGSRRNYLRRGHCQPRGDCGGTIALVSSPHGRAR